jgi:hypothetical protein
MSSKMKILSVTAVAAALLATVAVARTVRTHVAANAPALHATSGSAPQGTLRPHANFACAPSVVRNCEALDWFPE